MSEPRRVVRLWDPSFAGGGYWQSQAQSQGRTPAKPFEQQTLQPSHGTLIARRGGRAHGSFRNPCVKLPDGRRQAECSACHEKFICMPTGPVPDRCGGCR